MVQRVLHEGWRYQAVAEAFAVSVRTVAKWVQRYRLGGVAALEDASSRPGPPPQQTPPGTVAQIRVLRTTYGLPAWAIGRALQVPRSTVGAWLRRLGLSRPPVVPPVPVQRYEWPHPGDLLHLDIKPLGRIGCVGHRIHGDRRRATSGIGWEYVHVAIDDYSRLAYAEVLADETASTAAGFLSRAVSFYRRHGISVERVLTDNGSAYRAAVHAVACRKLGIRQLRTQPYRPQTNGCETRARFRLGPLPGSCRCCSCVTRPNGWLVLMPLL
jgi:transposase InsO family protein